MTKNVVEKYQKFWFEGFSYLFQKDRQSLKVELKYSLDRQVNFCEVLEIPVEASMWELVDKVALDRAMKAFFIIGGISYYKTYLPREMAGLQLTAEQAEFWQKVYQRGLGEFFYQNQIDFRGLINFPVTPDVALVGSTIIPARRESPDVAVGGELAERCLVPIGGGKDSIVSAELLKKGGIDFELFSLRDAEPIRATAEVIGKPRVVVQRTLDARLFELNEEGAFNGHVPITGYISFLLAVCAIIFDYKYLILSLEKSANFGQLNYHGMDVNHQYSKSEEFEGDLRDYLKKYVHGGIEYFSLLRGWNELRIAEVFGGLEAFERYAPVFTSCNANFKIVKEKSRTLWCGNCPKCLFVFLILAPFVERGKLVGIFGQNLLAREDLWGLLEELLGMRNFKPFECVGTSEESRVALWMLSRKAEWSGDVLVGRFVKSVLPQLAAVDWEKEREKALGFSSENFIPEKFRKLIEN